MSEEERGEERIGERIRRKDRIIQEVRIIIS